MSEQAPETIYLKDYKPFPYLIDQVDLTFRLDETATHVQSRIAFRPNPAAEPGDLVLDGVDLKLLSATIDGQKVHPKVTEKDLRVSAPNAPFVWECEVEIDPLGNTVLEGLYMSNGMYTTQCEAEGFRRITYYPDRPDVMSVFTVRIESDLPVLLSNGNQTARGPGWTEWHDPWPKPAYLFALVAGELVAHKDHFTTKSNQPVDLNIWVRAGDEDKCAYAMDALKRSMVWDEQVYGREYDLDVFNIVAVDDFNSGAMENKGLNIFNSKLVLASPETATDRDYELIEGVIAHEYFHNWTGNRITCRDWFQLCLKEGLTVFRDQQFSGDMRSHAIKRIDDVLTLRAAQFKEDAGPLAHPVRPESFVEINNFYTATVYEKGAEVIGMLKRLVGNEDYAKALELYFERHDGQATTIEAWLKVFEDATNRDLSQFARWYSQSGTPRLTVTDTFKDGTYTLNFKQETAATADQTTKQSLVMPIAVGLLNPNGDEVVPTTVLEMTEPDQSFTFEGLTARPVPSILRDFSAPVIVERETTNHERAFLLAHDTDPFNKWEAGRALSKDILINGVLGKPTERDILVDALARVIADSQLDPAFRAFALTFPSEDDIAQTIHSAGIVPDPVKIHQEHIALKQYMSKSLAPQLEHVFQQMKISGPFSPDPEAAGKRGLRMAALSYLSENDGGVLAQSVFETTDNMTEQFAAFSCLIGSPFADAAVKAFYDQWQAERLVIDKWFMVQPAKASPTNALNLTKALYTHPAFSAANPNRWRSLVNGLVHMNPAAFHAADGSAYIWFVDRILEMDAKNPQVAARATTGFSTWRRYDADRQDMIREQLERILATKDLSRDTQEIADKLLKD
jgi:aminopeptidase N